MHSSVAGQEGGERGSGEAEGKEGEGGEGWEQKRGKCRGGVGRELMRLLDVFYHVDDSTVLRQFYNASGKFGKH